MKILKYRYFSLFSYYSITLNLMYKIEFIIPVDMRDQLTNHLLFVNVVIDYYKIRNIPN